MNMNKEAGILADKGDLSGIAAQLDTGPGRHGMRSTPHSEGQEPDWTECVRKEEEPGAGLSL